MIRFVVFHLRSVVATLVAGALFESITLFSSRMYLPGIFFPLSLKWYLPGTFLVFTGVIILLCRRYIRIHMALWDMALLVMAYVATVLLMLLTEWRLVAITLEVLGALTIGTLVDILLSNSETTPVYVKKAFRRIRVMAWVFVVASIMIMLYAMSFFFPNIPLEVLFLFVGSVVAIGSYAIWRMYYQVPLGRFTVWLLIIAVMSMELFWVIHLLPFGYLVLGFLATWLWYLLLLLIRFHMSAEGIRWKEQRRFLLTNAGVFILLLFVIRWI